MLLGSVAHEEQRRGVRSAGGELTALNATVSKLKGEARFRQLRRSFETYYEDHARHDAMDALYADLVKPGGLAFDIGSHVGDRIASFRRLGARVVACEPQPDCVSALHELYGDDANVSVVLTACGREPGKAAMRINTANPTVSTLAADLIEASRDADGWREQRWDDEISVPVTTLDALIAQYGMPDFVKIDVEGFEADVLAGLSESLPALSFEFTTIQRDVAKQCLEHLGASGDYAFNFALGESQTMELTNPVSASEMSDLIADLPHAANSGDVYAIRKRSSGPIA